MNEIQYRTDVKPPLVIDGEMVLTDDTFPVIDPARPEDAVGHAPAATAEHARHAVDRAARAFGEWSARRPQERAAALIEALGGLHADNDERVEILVRENGKTRAEAAVEMQLFEGRCRLAPSLNQVRHLPGPPDQSGEAKSRQRTPPPPPDVLHRIPGHGSRPPDGCPIKLIMVARAY